MATAANAGTTVDCVAGAGSGSTECGANSTTSTTATPPVDATDATAIGDTATATGNQSTAVGHASAATGDATTAVGDEAADGDVCIHDFRLDDNIAADGAALYVSGFSNFYTYTGNQAELNSALAGDPDCGPEPMAALGAVACAAGTHCNEIAGNSALDSNNQPTSGSILTLGEHVYLTAKRFALIGNDAATLLRSAGEAETDVADYGTVLRHCLIADNHSQHELISIQNGRDLGMNGCTITHNTIDNGYVLYANIARDGLAVVNSILDQPGYSVLDYVGNTSNRTIDYVIANELTTLPGAQHAWSGALVYVDAANADYHLAANSMGVDYAPASGGVDLDGNPRDVDLPSRGNLYGPRDIGAYERQTGTCGTADSIFCNGFEL